VVKAGKAISLIHKKRLVDHIDAWTELGAAMSDVNALMRQQMAPEEMQARMARGLGPDPTRIPPELDYPTLMRILTLMTTGGGIGGAMGGVPGAIAGAGAGGLSAPYIHRAIRANEQQMDAENQPGGFYGQAPNALMRR
jgi:hypothetical protein